MKVGGIMKKKSRFNVLHTFFTLDIRTQITCLIKLVLRKITGKNQAW